MGHPAIDYNIDLTIITAESMRVSLDKLVLRRRLLEPGGSIKKFVMYFMKQHVAQEVRVPQIVNSIAGLTPGQVHTTLRHLRNRGILVKRGRGRYVLLA